MAQKKCLDALNATQKTSALCEVLFLKTLQDCKTLPRVHFIGCQGVKLFVPKDCFKFFQKLSCQILSF